MSVGYLSSSGVETHQVEQISDDHQGATSRIDANTRRWSIEEHLAVLHNVKCLLAGWNRTLTLITLASDVSEAAVFVVTSSKAKEATEDNAAEGISTHLLSMHSPSPLNP